MIREIVKIDREKCDGCQLCIPSCHEGALQIIDGKATLVSELMCDGLGACLGHCPQDAITIEKRDVPPYDEVVVIKGMIANGKNVIIAHLKHLKEHGETNFVKQAVSYLKEHERELPFLLQEVMTEVHNTQVHKKPNIHTTHKTMKHEHGNGGCPSSKPLSFALANEKPTEFNGEIASALRHWPIQLHLISPIAQYFKGADLLVAADCVAFTHGDFHRKYLNGKSLIIACPKLDSNTEIYIDKLIGLIDHAQVNTIQVMIMQVPCCRGLMQMVQSATLQALRKVPIKMTVVSIQGEILQEQWL